MTNATNSSCPDLEFNDGIPNACAAWKDNGECETSVSYMTTNCASTCELCPVDGSVATPANGTLTQMAILGAVGALLVCMGIYVSAVGLRRMKILAQLLASPGVAEATATIRLPDSEMSANSNFHSTASDGGVWMQEHGAGSVRHTRPMVSYTFPGKRADGSAFECYVHQQEIPIDESLALSALRPGATWTVRYLQSNPSRVAIKQAAEPEVDLPVSTHP